MVEILYVANREEFDRHQQTDLGEAPIESRSRRFQVDCQTADSDRFRSSEDFSRDSFCKEELLVRERLDVRGLRI